MTNKEKFLALVSKEETKTVENAKARLARKKYTRLSQKIALSILYRLDELDWKQVTLANQMGVSPQQVNKWVKGNENFTLDTLASLSEILGIDLISVPNFQEENESFTFQLEMNETYEVAELYSHITPEISMSSESEYENLYLIAN